MIDCPAHSDDRLSGPGKSIACDQARQSRRGRTVRRSCTSAARGPHRGLQVECAKVYKTEIENGGIVIGVKPRSAEDVTHFEEEWSRHGGGDIRR